MGFNVFSRAAGASRCIASVVSAFLLRAKPDRRLLHISLGSLHASF